MFADAVVHHKAGHLAEAAKLYCALLELSSHHFDTLRLLGALYIQNGESTRALPILQRALSAQPKNPEILNNLGAALRDCGRGDEAAVHFQQALAINPTFVDALLNLGAVLAAEGNDEAASECYEKASKQNPGDVYVLRNLAKALWQLGRKEEAYAKIKRALRAEPKNPEVITTFGVLLQEDGKINEALKYYNRSLAHAPEFPLALWQKSLALLAMGNYREGWRLYEAGLGRKRGPNHFAAFKTWNGEVALDKHLLIWTEQGLGDSLQFIRYAALCKQRVGKVTVLCAGQKPLVRLFKNLPFIDDAFEGTVPDGTNFVEQVPLMSLPHIFNTVLENVPASVPYLCVDSTIQEKWNRRIARVDAPKVGLVWAGSSHQGHVDATLMDQRRSIGLERMKAWLTFEDLRFYSLQKGPSAKEVITLGLQDRVVDFMSEVEDFADTAAIIQNLDLVITVDTSVAHLAGGLGKPVWILSRYDADWRWLQNRPTSPWYPTARIFGQPSPGDWGSVLSEVRRELVIEITKRRSLVM